MSQGEWQEAIAILTRALKTDHRNPQIALKMGVIYEERGMHDEAKFWFQNATDLDPSLQTTRHINVQPSKSPARTAKKRIRTPAWLEKYSSLNLPAIAVGLLVVVVVFVSLLLVTGSGRSGREQSAERTPGDAASRTFGGTTGNYAAPLTTPRATTVPPATPTAPASSSVRTQAELHIREQLRSSKEVKDAGAQVDDVIADPRSGLALVTISLSSKQTPSKSGVLNAAAAAAAAAFIAHQQVKYATVRCLTSYGGEAGTQVLFVGDVARPSADSLAGEINEDQIRDQFANHWWNPSVK